MDGNTTQPRPTSFFRDFFGLAGHWWTGPTRWRAIGLTLTLLALGTVQVLLAIRINLWMADLFDAVERRAFDRFQYQVMIFVILVLGIMASNAAHLMVKRRMQIAWRRWLTVRMLGTWMDDARHYQIGLIPGDHDNPDGRIAEDIRIATEYAIDLASTLFYAVLLLVSFIGILWSLSGIVTVFGLPIPGHLVLLACLYAAGGSAAAWTLGRPLTQATDDRQSREADFRFRLVRARETAEPIALARGEWAERAQLTQAFSGIPPAWGAQSRGLARIVFFTSGYTTLAPVFPILVETPRLLAGALTLGGLMQAAQAFQQVAAALSWPVDNLQRLAEWRASVERVLLLADAVQEAASDAARPGDSAIVVTRAAGASIAASGVCIATAQGDAELSNLDIEIGPAETVRIDGDLEASALLFRVLAGIWPWGYGEIRLPQESEIITIGAQPFMSNGPLRAALVFPAPPGSFTDEALCRALEDVGLSGFTLRLDEEADWPRNLGSAETRRLSVARLLLHGPAWIVMSDALDGLDPDAADALLATLREQLPQTTVIVTGRHQGSDSVFTRRMTLRRNAAGEATLEEIRARRMAAGARRRRALPMVDWLRRGFGFYR